MKTLLAIASIVLGTSMPGLLAQQGGGPGPAPTPHNKKNDMLASPLQRMGGPHRGRGRGQ